MSLFPFKQRTGKNPCLYFGTFNPVHLGHLQLAQGALSEYGDKLGFETVLFVPTGVPPHRQADTDLADAAHRLKIVELAIAGHPHFSCTAFEMNKTTPSYTVETLEEWMQSGIISPPCPFIIGSDALAGLSDWYAPEKLLQYTTLLQAPRPGFFMMDTFPLQDTNEPLASYRLHHPQSAISSSWVREKVRQKDYGALTYALPAAVLRYLQENHVYENVTPPREPAGLDNRVGMSCSA